MHLRELTPDEERVIVHKGTEAPYTGEYDNFFKEGTYACRRCDLPLFSSKAKYDAGCGWPAFEEFLPGSVKQHGVPNQYMGYEIECSRCGAHLGHAFLGERLTDTNVRHCANSLSIRFVPA